MRIRKCLLSFILVFIVVALISCIQTCNHEWQDGDCGSPRQCIKCGYTDGVILKHTGGIADCMYRAICEKCGKTYGELDPNNHVAEIGWGKNAEDHYEAYLCCGAAISSPEKHNKVNGVCSVCGFDPIIKVSRVDALENGKITVAISINDNPGLLGLEISVAFDSNNIKLIDAKNGAAMQKMSFTASDDYSAGGKFLWDNIEVSQMDIKDGEILILTFDVFNAAKGSYTILLNVNAFDGELNQVTFKIENGLITVE